MARELRKMLLVLDPNEGSDADRLYVRLGWARVATVPDYSLQPPRRLRALTLFDMDL
jgi:hypothetical protein